MFRFFIPAGLCFAAVLLGCTDVSPPETSAARPFVCALEFREDGWTSGIAGPTPREDEPVGAEHGVFAVSFPNLSEAQFRARASALATLVTERVVPPAEWEMQEQWSAESQSLLAEGVWANWNAKHAWLEVAATSQQQDDSGAPEIGDAEAFRRFRCVLLELERAELIEPGSVPAEGAQLSFRVSSTWSGGGEVETRVEAYEFRSHRLLGGVLEPQNQVSARIGATGAVEHISVGMVSTATDGPPQREVPAAPGFRITRAVTTEALHARFLAEAEAARPGTTVQLTSSGLFYRRRPESFGEALVPMQMFHFFYEGVPSRGGNGWSYRIDDPDAPRWTEFGE